MNAGAAAASPAFDSSSAAQNVNINWDALGAFFYNPHPPVGKGVPKVVNGVTYPFGAEVAIVAGKHYAILPQSILNVPSADPNFALIVQNIETMIGQWARNDRGVRRLDLAQMAERGPDYLREIDAAGASVLAETIHRTVVVALEKENESRVARKLAPREYTHEEQGALFVFEGVIARLKKQEMYDKAKHLEQIKKGAQAIPDFAVTLSALPIADLRKRARLANLIITRDMKKEQLISILEEHRKEEIAQAKREGREIAAADHEIPMSTEEGDGGGDVDLDETIDVTGAGIEED